MTIARSDLSEDQQEVFRLLTRWADDQLTVDKPDYLTIGGFAGTGKTTLLALYAQSTGRKIAFASYTGKAAGNLRKRLSAAGVKPFYCGTLHALLYEARELPGGKIEFVPREFLTAPDGEDEFGRPRRSDVDMVIVDEASMVPKEIFDLLLTHEVPVVFVGDHGQLPPVTGNFNIMEKPHLRLEKIHRQAEGNPIIKLAEAIRTKGDIDMKHVDGQHVQVVGGGTGAAMFDALFTTSPDLFEQAVICHTNKLRQQLNAHARRLLGYGERLLYPGEQVMCLKNEPATSGAYNGMRAQVREIRSVIKNLHVEMILDSPDEGRSFWINKALLAQFGQASTFSSWEAIEDATYGAFKPRNWWEVGSLFDYGYALTCHKAQGSQWPTVLVAWDMSSRDRDLMRRWRYTAVTRASERLIIVR